jgi:hypothetical protein
VGIRHWILETRDPGAGVGVIEILDDEVLMGFQHGGSPPFGPRPDATFYKTFRFPDYSIAQKFGIDNHEFREFSCFNVGTLEGWKVGAFGPRKTAEGTRLDERRERGCRRERGGVLLRVTARRLTARREWGILTAVDGGSRVPHENRQDKDADYCTK